MNIVVTPVTHPIKMPEEPFHKWAKQFLKCKRELKTSYPNESSPIPYYLLCHAIELEIKARLSKTKSWKELKKDFCHDLMKAYNALDNSQQKILSDEDIEILKKVNLIYMEKGFEYILPFDLLTKNRRYPDLALLDSIASKLIGI